MSAKSTKPIPTRFEPPEEKALEEISTKSGLSKSEIIRRAVRLLRLEVAQRGAIGFIVEELGPDAASTKGLVSYRGGLVSEEPPRKQSASGAA